MNVNAKGQGGKRGTGEWTVIGARYIEDVTENSSVPFPIKI